MRYLCKSVAIIVALLLFSLIHAVAAETRKKTKESKLQANNIVLVTYNTHNGIGMDKKTDYARIAKVIKPMAPDVVALQELDNRTKRSKNINVIEEIAKEAGMEWTYAKAIDYQGGAYGLGILSKEKPLRTSTLPLPGREEKRVLLMAEFSNYCVYATHLSLKTEDRLEALTIITEAAKKEKKPTFLMGDFNFRPESEEMTKLKKSFQVLNNVGEKTFPSPEPKESIDYIVYYNGGNGNSVEVLGSEVIDERIASDHRPVKVTIKR